MLCPPRTGVLVFVLEKATSFWATTVFEISGGKSRAGQDPCWWQEEPLTRPPAVERWGLEVCSLLRGPGWEQRAESNRRGAPGPEKEEAETVEGRGCGQSDWVILLPRPWRAPCRDVFQVPHDPSPDRDGHDGSGSWFCRWTGENAGPGLQRPSLYVAQATPGANVPGLTFPGRLQGRVWGTHVTLS